MSKACIDRSDSWIFQHKRRPPVTKYKKYILGSHTRPLKFIFAPLKAKHFIGKLWQLMTTSNVGAWTQAWQAKWAVSKPRGLSTSVSFLSSPPPPRSFTYTIFRAVFDSRSSFFVACVASVSVRFPPLSFFGSCFISRAAKTENPVPPRFFTPKPNGNACYAGYPICCRTIVTYD